FISMHPAKVPTKPYLPALIALATSLAVTRPLICSYWQETNIGSNIVRARSEGIFANSRDGFRYPSAFVELIAALRFRPSLQRLKLNSNFHATYLLQRQRRARCHQQRTYPMASGRQSGHFVFTGNQGYARSGSAYRI